MTTKLTRWEMAKAIAGDQSSNLELRWLKKDEHGQLFGEGTVYSSYKKIREVGDNFLTEVATPTEPPIPEFKGKPQEIIRFLKPFNDLDLANCLMNSGEFRFQQENGPDCCTIYVHLMVVNEYGARELFGEDEYKNPMKISEPVDSIKGNGTMRNGVIEIYK